MNIDGIGGIDGTDLDDDDLDYDVDDIDHDEDYDDDDTPNSTCWSSLVTLIIMIKMIKTMGMILMNHITTTNLLL